MRLSFALKCTAIFSAIFLNNHINAQNDTVVAQFSVLPGLSTNGDSASKITNHLSFNLFAGYNGGVEGAEIAAIANINNYNVTGLQIAGISNVNKAEATALQVSGIFNYTEKEFKGFQVSGISNMTKSRFEGLQASGIFNHTQEMIGAQITGITGNAKDVTGLQLSGLASNARRVRGLQVSGIVNRSYRTQGMQLAALVNVTERLEGVQLGLINYSGSGHRGVPIGFISIARNGYAAVDFSFNEIMPLTLAVKTGVNPFYNVFLASSNFEEDNLLWTVGYGLGSRILVGNVLALEFELTASHLSKEQFTQELNALGRFNFNLAFDIGGFMEMYVGPSVNAYFTQVYNPDTDKFGHDIAPGQLFYEEIVYDYDKPTLIQAWIGAQVGMRFFI
ncbi:MAG: hypothetical protein N4A46_08140 [Schleiferiaceae bacterium]|jgi:hypothetical protein|nr:hypothetical protein [Schleiferiaceae bacterium]